MHMRVCVCVHMRVCVCARAYVYIQLVAMRGECIDHITAIGIGHTTTIITEFIITTDGEEEGLAVAGELLLSEMGLVSTCCRRLIV